MEEEYAEARVQRPETGRNSVETQNTLIWVVEVEIPWVTVVTFLFEMYHPLTRHFWLVAHMGNPFEFFLGPFLLPQRVRNGSGPCMTSRARVGLGVHFVHSLAPRLPRSLRSLLRQRGAELA